METISRTWELMQESFALISQDKKLILFPIFSSLALILMDSSFFVGFARINQWTSPTDRYAYMLFFYCANCFVVIFFNSALMACAALRLAGVESTLGDGFHAAGSRLGRIVLWAIIAGTVGFALQMLRRAGLIQRLVVGILGIAWSLATYFIIPVIILEDLDIIDSFKRSSDLFRRRWGDEVVSNFSFTLVAIVVIIPAVVLCFFAYVLSPSAASAALFILALAYLVVMLNVVAAAQGVFTVALYHYASDRQIVSGFSSDLLQDAFSGTGRRPRG
jgi:hypothetical protein